MDNFKLLKDECVAWIKDWFDENGKDCNAVVGLSGGKDSTIVAALCMEALGKDRVIGVGIPQGDQSLNEADEIAKYLGIKFKTANIGKVCKELVDALGYGVHPKCCISTQSLQNIPPRIRMTVLYAVAQTENGRVACCDNASENYLGYSTLFGDDVGSFAPLLNLTVTEVRGIGDALGLPRKWVHKIPDDGLPASDSDEKKFGFSYDTLDTYIKTFNCDDKEVKEKIDRMHKNSQFKRDIIHIPAFDPYAGEPFKPNINDNSI